MPYVPSLKTDGKSQDRVLIDKAVEELAQKIASSISRNFAIIGEYKQTFISVARVLSDVDHSWDYREVDLGRVIVEIAKKYDYHGAFLGELNYAITRLIQRVPQIMVASGKWQAKDELRYWLYAATVEALVWTAHESRNFGIGVSGVFEDIKDEYKRRMNTAYEAAQIVKSGDCYDGPYYTRLVEVVDGQGKHIGYIEVMLKRSEETLNLDVLKHKLTLRLEEPKGVRAI